MTSNLVLLNQELVEATYAIQPNVDIFCRLELQRTQAQGIWTTMVGIRRPRDTRLALGAKLNLTAESSGTAATFSTQVVEIIRRDKVDLHVLAEPIPAEPTAANPAPDEPETRVRAFLPEQFSMKDVRVTRTGLKFVSTTRLTSAAIGTVMPIYLDCSDKTPFDCRVSHILYNWWTNIHVVSVNFEAMTERQLDLLGKLLGQDLLGEAALLGTSTSSASNVAQVVRIDRSVVAAKAAGGTAPVAPVAPVSPVSPADSFTSVNPEKPAEGAVASQPAPETEKPEAPVEAPLEEPPVLVFPERSQRIDPGTGKIMIN